MAQSTLPLLQTLVLKDGVSLGGLVPAQRELALGLVHALLPAADAMSEPQVNQHLLATLANPGGPACWMATDHVELRRWLVDAGWLWRDDYGRVYRRVAIKQLAPAQQAIGHALTQLAVAPWVQGLRQRRDDERAARRARFKAAASPARPTVP